MTDDGFADFQPTNRLRFVERRAHGADKSRMILQQLWRKPYPWGPGETLWRDVPIELEEPNDV